MNAVSVALASILGTIALVGAVLGGVALYRRSRASSQEQIRVLADQVKAVAAQTEALTKHSASIDKYSEATAAATGSLKDLPKLIEGVGRLCAAQVVEIGNLRKEVKALREAIFKKDDVRGFEMPTDSDKDFSWRAQQYMAQDSSLKMEDAIAKVIDEESKRIMSPGAFELG